MAIEESRKKLESIKTRLACLKEVKDEARRALKDEYDLAFSEMLREECKIAHKIHVDTLEKMQFR